MYILETDKFDIITHINQAWRDFALDNQGDHLLNGRNVINTSIWDHITDPGTRHIYRLVVKHVREHGGKSLIPFRCDSPDSLRFMEMEIELLANSGIRYTSTLIREEHRRPVPFFWFIEESSSTEQVLTVCSWCKKIQNDRAEFVEIEHAVRQMRLLEANTVPPISHGMCPTCWTEYADKFLAALV
ncbi:MAG TPA: hypothetical protein PKE64_06065 [Anaerolineae bacterium]|nr:hypothetical protein [Anaerolineae bacterium]HMR63563.1 hypothetical protein [Anaerolineae bacterium]